MHSDEPTLLDHLISVRQKISPEDGGVSTIIYCGIIKSENDMTEVRVYVMAHEYLIILCGANRLLLYIVVWLKMKLIVMTVISLVS